MTKFAVINRKAFDFGIGMELYPAEIHMLTAVDMRGSTGVTELAEDLGVTKGAVSQQISKLVNKGLLTKESDPDNRSRVRIMTTEKGHEASDNHLDFHREHDRRFLEYLGTLDEHSYATVMKLGKEMNLWMDRYLE